jgi:hypothetical protein
MASPPVKNQAQVVVAPPEVSDANLDLLLGQLERRLSAEWEAINRLVGRMAIILTILAAVPSGLTLGSSLKGLTAQPELEGISLALMFTAAIVSLVYISAQKYDFPPGAEMLYYLATRPTRDIKWSVINSLTVASKRNTDRLARTGRALNIALILFITGSALFALSVLIN